MSYIACLRCQDGIVMCADTQVSVGDYKNYEEKLEIVPNQSYPLSIGGAGYGDIIEAVHQEIINRAESEKPETIARLEKMLRACLREVYEKDVPALVIKKQHRSPEFLIAAKPYNDDYCIFRVRGRRLYRGEKYGIVGYGTEYNSALLKRLYRDSLPMSQAVLLATYLVSQSKLFDEGVGGQTSIAVVKDNGAYLDEKEYIATLEERAHEFLPIADEFFIACTDVGLSKSQFDEKLRQFESKARESRRKAIHVAAQRAFIKLTGGEFPMMKDPYPKFPLGGHLSMKKDADGYMYFEGNEEAPEIPEPVKQWLKEEREKKQAESSKPSASQKSTG